MNSALKHITRLEHHVKDDNTQVSIYVVGNNKTIDKADELFQQWLLLGTPELYVVNSTDEIKEYFSGYTKQYKILFSSSYDDAYNAIFPNG